MKGISQGKTSVLNSDLGLEETENLNPQVLKECLTVNSGCAVFNSLHCKPQSSLKRRIKNSGSGEPVCRNSTSSKQRLTFNASGSSNRRAEVIKEHHKLTHSKLKLKSNGPTSSFLNTQASKVIQKKTKTG